MALSCCEVALPKHQELHIDDLPSEILFHIFLRLPLKSIGRAKCTSKLWYSTISDRTFTEIHLKHAVKNPGHLYMFKDSNPNTYFVEGVSDGIEVIRISSGALMEDPKTSGGLVTAVIENEKCCYICNPIIGEQIKVPMDPYIGGDFRIKWWGFGYSSSTNEFKIVLFGSALPETSHLVLQGAVYTLGSESWRDIPHVPFHPMRPHFPIYPKSHECVDCDGTLFWLISHDDSSNCLDTIGSFDIGSEVFRGWHGPPSEIGDEESSVNIKLCLMNFGDTIACLRRKEHHHYVISSIWKLRDKVNEAWVKVYKSRSRCTVPAGLWMNRDLLVIDPVSTHYGSRTRPRSGHRFKWATFDSKTGNFRDLSLPFDENSDGSLREHGLNISHVGCLISPSLVVARVKKKKSSVGGA